MNTKLYFNIIKNFPEPVQEFLIGKEKELDSVFVGCTESDWSFIFKDSEGALTVVDTTYCETQKCDKFMVPVILENDFCPGCGESYFPVIDEED